MSDPSGVTFAAIEQVRENLEVLRRYAKWMQNETLLDAVEAIGRENVALQALAEAAATICDEPTTVGPAHDKATRVTSYRALREILGPPLARVRAGAREEQG